MLFKKTQLDQIEINNCHDGVGSVFSLEKIFNKESTGFRFFHETTIPPGSTIGIHGHEDSREELFVIKEGTGIYSEDGREHEVGPGDICFFNKNTGVHGIRPAGKQPLVMLVIGVNI
ncbi:MAG: cupin domain-containing protein [Proteobacteria bacterium]|nr:cupin domain-containing protein [Pseudomonadota bacterium]